MDDVRVHPETLAGDPFAAAPKRARRSRRTEAELVEAISEDDLYCPVCGVEGE